MKGSLAVSTVPNPEREIKNEDVSLKSSIGWNELCALDGFRCRFQ